MNHQSLLDILVIFGLFFPFKWVSKAEIFNIPFIGWNMVLNRYIGIRRGDKTSIKEMMEECEEHLTKGSSICMFPEGTRSKSGEVSAFKPGAFYLAKKLQLPILPIVIDGTANALPKSSLNFHGKHAIKVSVLPAVEPSSFEQKEVEVLAEEVRRLMKAKNLQITID